MPPHPPGATSGTRVEWRMAAGPPSPRPGAARPCSRAGTGRGRNGRRPRWRRERQSGRPRLVATARPGPGARRSQPAACPENERAALGACHPPRRSAATHASPAGRSDRADGQRASCQARHRCCRRQPLAAPPHSPAKLVCWPGGSGCGFSSTSRNRSSSLPPALQVDVHGKSAGDQALHRDLARPHPAQHAPSRRLEQVVYADLAIVWVSHCIDPPG